MKTFHIGTALFLLASASSAAMASIGQTIEETVNESTFTPSEITDGLKASAALLKNEVDQNGEATELFSLMTDLQQTLIAKADDIGMSESDIKDALDIDSIDVDENDAGGEADDNALGTDEDDPDKDIDVAGAALANSQLNGATADHVI